MGVHRGFLLAIVVLGGLGLGASAAVVGPADRCARPGLARDVVVQVGTHGDDVLELTEATDLVCGRGGDDLILTSPRTSGIGSGDVVIGGRGDDHVGNSGQIDLLFVGGPGDDSIEQDFWGTFVGGPGSDRVGPDMNGRFFGGPGNDVGEHVGQHGVAGVLFRGGPGNDTADFLTDAVFVGGPGRDVVRNQGSGLFLGGPGHDRVHTWTGGLYHGGPGADVLVTRAGGWCRSVAVGCAPSG